MEKIYRTTAYSRNTPLRLKSGGFFSSGPEIKAKVNMKTGEVKLFIDKEDLEQLKRNE